MKLPELSVEEFIRRVQLLPETPRHSLTDAIHNDYTNNYPSDPCVIYSKGTTTPWRWIAVLTDKDPFCTFISSSSPENFKQLQEAAKNNFQPTPPFDPYTNKVTLPTFTDSVGISLERTICEQVSSEELIQAGRNLAKWLQKHSGPSLIRGILSELKQDC